MASGFIFCMDWPMLFMEPATSARRIRVARNMADMVGGVQSGGWCRSQVVKSNVVKAASCK